MQAVARKVNLADPDFEPTDDELQQLVHEAFAEVAAQRTESAARLRARIAKLRDDSRANLREILDGLARPGATERA